MARPPLPALAALALLLAAGMGAALPLPPPLGHALERVAQVAHGGGGGLWIDGDRAYSSGLGGGFFVSDIRDPTAPVKLGQLTGMYMRDAGVLHLGERTMAVSASDGGGMRFLDATDPAQLRLVSTIRPANVHNIATVDGTPYVYNSRGGGSGSVLRIDIVDASVPEAPVLARTWTASGTFHGVTLQSSSCHDLEVRVEAKRAYCAGGRQSVVLDIADPLEPVVLSVLENPFIAYHHWAVPSDDNRLLILGDEDFGGGYSRFAGLDNCAGGLTTPVATVSMPQGAIWFYDIQDPANPVLLSWLSPPLPEQSGTCTSHFGQVLPGQAMVAVGWYRGGVSLVDFTIPALPKVVAQFEDNVNAWDVRAKDGHLFTGDINRGMDVLRIVGPGL
jgi:hypothetical protein